MYKLVIIALLAAVACGFPATGVDDHSATQRPVTTEAQPNYLPQDPRQESDSLDPLELKENSTLEAAKPKRAVCVGLISACTQTEGGLKEVTLKILETDQENMKTVVGGFIDMTKVLTSARNNRLTPQERITSP